MRALVVMAIFVLSGCVSNGKKFEETQFVPPSHARIFFYRNSGVWGMGQKSNVQIDSTEIKSLTNGEYISMDVDSKPHVFIIRNMGSPITRTFSFQLYQPGSYFIRLKPVSIKDDAKDVGGIVPVFFSWPGTVRDLKGEVKEDSVSFSGFDIIKSEVGLREIQSLRLVED